MKLMRGQRDAALSDYDHIASELFDARDAYNELANAVDAAARAVLRHIAQTSEMTSHDRITLYRALDDDRLGIVARFSQDSNWSRISDTSLTFGHDHGLIGRAHRTGVRVESTCPAGDEFTKDPTKYRGWQLTASSLPTASISEPRLKSVRYVVVPIWDTAEHARRLGVVCLEASQRRYKATSAAAALLEDEQQSAIRMIREILVLSSNAAHNLKNEPLAKEGTE